MAEGGKVGGGREVKEYKTFAQLIRSAAEGCPPRTTACEQTAALELQVGAREEG